MAEKPPPYRRPVLPWERGPSAEVSGARWASVGIEFGLCTLAFFLGGRALDASLSSAPLWTVVGSLLGVFVGMYLLVRSALRGQRPAPKDGPAAGSDAGEGSKAAEDRPPRP